MRYLINNNMAPKDIIAPQVVGANAIQPVKDEDLRFRFIRDMIATEGNNFLVFADNGHFCLISVMLINAVFKKHQFVITVKLFDEKFHCKTIVRHYGGKDVRIRETNHLLITEI